MLCFILKFKRGVNNLNEKILESIYSNWQSNDPAIPKAKRDIMAFFEKNKSNVYYSRQIEVTFEHKYFHWITNAALNQLADDGLLTKNIEKVNKPGVKLEIHFFRHKSLRYFKSKQNELIDSIVYYSKPEFSTALGNQGEILVSNGLFRAGFQFISEHSNSYKDREWTETNHNFDFIVEKDGIGYAVEVKNTLGYMNKKELDVLLVMADYLDLKPIFACRMLPSSWIHDIYSQHDGFSWIFKYQMYPYSESTNAMIIKDSLGLPVDSPRALYDSTLNRLTSYHNGVKKRIGKNSK